jgi:hypothetical protein
MKYSRGVVERLLVESRANLAVLELDELVNELTR